MVGFCFNIDSSDLSVTWRFSVASSNFAFLQQRNTKVIHGITFAGNGALFIDKKNENSIQILGQLVSET